MTSIALYQALKSLKVEDSLAKAAAEEGKDTSARLAVIESELRTIRWVLGIIAASLFALGAGILSILLQI